MYHPKNNKTSSANVGDNINARAKATKRSLLESLIEVDPLIKQEPPLKRSRSVSSIALPKRVSMTTLDLVSSSNSSSDDEETKRENADHLVEQLIKSPLVNPSPPHLARRKKHESRIKEAPLNNIVLRLSSTKSDLDALLERAVENMAMLRYITSRIKPHEPYDYILGLHPSTALHMIASLRKKIHKDARDIKEASHRLATTYRKRYGVTATAYSSDDELSD